MIYWCFFGIIGGAKRHRFLTWGRYAVRGNYYHSEATQVHSRMWELFKEHSESSETGIMSSAGGLLNLFTSLTGLDLSSLSSKSSNSSSDSALSIDQNSSGSSPETEKSSHSTRAGSRDELDDLMLLDVPASYWPWELKKTLLPTPKSLNIWAISRAFWNTNIFITKFFCYEAYTAIRS